MLGRLLRGAQEARAVSYQQVFGSGGEWGTATVAGPAVGSDSALQIGAVYACVRLISDTVSTLPVDSFQRRDGQRVPLRPRPAWLSQTDLGCTWADHVQQVAVSLLIDGNAFVEVRRGTEGEPAALLVHDPRGVEIRQAGSDVEFVLADRRVLPRADGPAPNMLHLTECRRPGQLRGVSRVSQARQSLGLAAALEEFAARFFGQGSQAGGVLQTDAALTEEQARQLVMGWEKAHKGLRRAHRPAVLHSGAKFTKTTVDNEQAQFLQSRQFAVEEIARIFRVPPHMIGVTTPGAMSYASVEANAIQFATYTLRPIVAKLENAYSALLPGTGSFVRLNMDGILRGDLGSRYTAYAQGVQGGFLSINDIHRLEDMPPVDGGGVYRVPLANVDLAAASITETDHKVAMATKLITVGFAPAAALAAVGLPPIEHSGLPSVQLQGVATVNPADPAAAYPEE